MQYTGPPPPAYHTHIHTQQYAADAKLAIAIAREGRAGCAEVLVLFLFLKHHVQLATRLVVQ